MKELENLLNKLIEKWWKPWGIEPENIELFSLDIKRKNIHIWYMDYDTPEEENYEQEFKSFRELASMESWLWQFLWNSKLHKKTDNFRENVHKTRHNIWWFPHNHEYRLIESALTPEEGLAKFLIENIKI